MIWIKQIHDIGHSAAGFQHQQFNNSFFADLPVCLQFFAKNMILVRFMKIPVFKYFYSVRPSYLCCINNKNHHYMNPTTGLFLDVTTLEPRQKHPTIFQMFDELHAGDTLTIHNDHDPKPLYYQLLGERGNSFEWQYLEQGPESWRVNIRKRNADEPEETIGEIAAKDLRKVAIFKKYGIDFCCGGKKTVKEACAEKGLDSTRIEQELQQADPITEAQPLSYQEWPLHFLADYIVNVHHSYVRKTLPDLLSYAAKVNRVHGKSHPELSPINQLVVEINNELVAHLEEEETVLFPAVKAMSQSGTIPDSLEQMLNSMQDEHTQVGKKLAIIQQLSNGYTIPEDACSSYSILYRMLRDFQTDLEMHIHLENNVLCPKALSQLKS